MKKKIRLGINIDHVATLRQVRGGKTIYPDLVEVCHLAKQGGADQITIHLREDQRHIQKSDLPVLSKLCPLPINLEMAVTAGMVKLARKYRPAWCCMVPEKRQELTTEGGLNVYDQVQKISRAIDKLQYIGIEVSLFIDPNELQVRASYRAGADAIELHTGTWVLAKGRQKTKIWNQLVKAAQLANQLGMSVHAGHGLDYVHAKKILQLPHLREVNIGHFLVCDSIKNGLLASTQKMVKVLSGKSADF